MKATAWLQSLVLTIASCLIIAIATAIMHSAVGRQCFTWGHGGCLPFGRAPLLEQFVFWAVCVQFLLIGIRGLCVNAYLFISCVGGLAKVALLRATNSGTPRREKFPYVIGPRPGPLRFTTGTALPSYDNTALERPVSVTSPWLSNLYHLDARYLEVAVRRTNIGLFCLVGVTLLIFAALMAWTVPGTSDRFTGLIGLGFAVTLGVLGGGLVYAEAATPVEHRIRFNRAWQKVYVYRFLAETAPSSSAKMIQCISIFHWHELHAFDALASPGRSNATKVILRCTRSPGAHPFDEFDLTSWDRGESGHELWSFVQRYMYMGVPDTLKSRRCYEPAAPLLAGQLAPPFRWPPELDAESTSTPGTPPTVTA